MTSDSVAAGRLSRAGDCIDGRYQLETEIGAGGLGSVYRATQTKLARAVAVKLLHESTGISEVQRARFEREAKALAALEHPNIVSILDYGVADGQPYIVMELLEGETLAQRLRSGRLPLDQALPVVEQLLDALAFMHEAGVVHRDLKASNVFLQRVHQGERVKVLDFGLAKTTAALGSSGDTTLTRDGTVVGTPAYMSPEQATGDVVDARSDVYAVGVLLFQMLSGRLPFEGDAIDQVRSHLVEPVPVLSAATPSPPLDAALDRLIRRAMAKRREERFEHARAMLLELTRVLSNNGRSTLPPPTAHAGPLLTGKQLRAWLGTALRALAALSVLTLAAEAIVLWQLSREPADRALLQALRSRLAALASARLPLPPESPSRPRRAPPVDTIAARPAQQSPTETLIATAPAPGTAAVNAPDPNADGLPLHAAGARAALPEAGAVQAAAGLGGAAVAGAAGAAGTAGVAASTARDVDPAVPGPPRARNPWARGVPRELRGIRKAVLAGGVGDERSALALRAYNQGHPGDARGHLLLALMYLNRNWRSDAVGQFASALREDLSARGAPEVLDKLTELVRSGKGDAEAGRLIVRAYGTEAVARLDKLIARTQDAGARARLRALRGRIAPTASRPGPQ